MKSYKNILISVLLISIVSTTLVKGQESEGLRYKIRQEFTGEIREGEDSVYSVTCVIDRRTLSEHVKVLNVTVGSRPGANDMFNMSLDSADVVIGSERRVVGVRKSRNSLEIDLGEYTAGARHIDVWAYERSKKADRRSGRREGKHRRAVRDDRMVINESN